MKDMRTELYRAAISCGHEITHEQIILYVDSRKEGNALSQLADRLEQAALSAVPANHIGDSNEMVSAMPAQEPVKKESKPSIDDIQSLVDASVIMLEWCVKNVKAWNFSEYDWLHRSTERVKKSLPPAKEVTE